jgi:hypothetical protein
MLYHFILFSVNVGYSDRTYERSESRVVKYTTIQALDKTKEAELTNEQICLHGIAKNVLFFQSNCNLR